MSLPSKLWRAIRYDIGRKLTALGLAVATWFILESVVLADMPNRKVEVKYVPSIEAADLDRAQSSKSAVYLIVPDSLVVLSCVPDELDLNVKGLKKDVENLVLSATVVLSDADLKEGEDAGAVIRTLQRESFKSRGERPELTQFQINRVVDKEVVRGSSADLSITIARKATLDMTLGPANVQFTGDPASGYEVDTSHTLIQPNALQVSGPRTAIQKLRADPGMLKLAPVAVDGRSASVTKSVGLAETEDNKHVTLGAKDYQVSVTIPIVPKPKRRELRAIPVTFLNEDWLKTQHKRIAETGRPAPTVDLVVMGPPGELDSLSNEELAQRIHPTFDFKTAGVLKINHKSLDIFTKDLSDAVKVYGLDNPNEPPQIQYTLEDAPESQ
jgi:hypothetical protein